MIIFEMGSADTCKNDVIQIRAMIDAIAEVDKKRESVLKWQLFLEQRFNHVQSLSKGCFGVAYLYAKNLGFKTTASVFDRSSLDFLLKYGRFA